MRRLLSTVILKQETQTLRPLTVTGSQDGSFYIYCLTSAWQYIDN